MTFSRPSRGSPAPQPDLGQSSWFPERSWEPQPDLLQPEENSQDPPDLQTQLERANRLGHDFGSIQLFSPTPTVQAQTQPQQTEEQEPEVTASDPKFSFAAGSDSPPPPGFPEGSLGSTQPRFFLQRNPLPTRQSSQPRISGHTSMATELAQLLQAKEDRSESEPQSTPPATLQDEIGAVDTLLLQQIPLLSQRLLQASHQGIVQPSTFDTWDQLSQALISAYPATQAAQRGEVAVPEAQQQDLATLSQGFFDALQQDMLDSPGVGKILPLEIAGAGRILSEMAMESHWSELYRKFYSVSAGLDRWLSTQASFAGEDQAAQESEQRAEQTAGLSEVQDQLVDLQGLDPTRIPVTFTMASEEKEQEELSDVPEAIPMSFYLWQAEDQWHLRQVVPGGPFTNTVPIREGQTEPPPELFAELDSKLRFPKGTLRYQIPGGREGEVQVTGEMTVQEILGWVALALGLAALAATGVGAVAGGAGLAALAGSAKGVAFMLAVGSTVAGAGSSGLSLGEQFQHGNPDGMQVTLDVVGIASSVLSLGSLVAGKIAVSQAAKGTVLAKLAGRTYIPLLTGTVAADVAGLTLVVVEAPGQIQAVMEGEGTDEEKLRAMVVLLSQLAVAGVLTQISIQGDLGDIRSGGVLRIDVENGVPIARVGGEADARLGARAELTEEPDGGGSTRIEEPEGTVKPPETGSTGIVAATDQVVQIREQLSEAAQAEFDVMRSQIGDDEVFLTKIIQGDPVRRFEGIAGKKANAAARQAQEQAELQSAVEYLRASGFLDRSDVQEVLEQAKLLGKQGSEGLKALRSLIAVDLARQDLATRFPETDGYKIFDGVLLLEEIPGGYTSRESFIRDNPQSNTPIQSIIQEGGKLYKRRNDIDLMVQQTTEGGPARVERIEEVKSGNQDQHSKARGQLEQKTLVLLQRIAGGDPTVIMYYQDQNITSSIDASSVSVDKLFTRGPKGKGFQESVGFTSKQMDNLAKQVVAEEGQKQ